MSASQPRTVDITVATTSRGPDATDLHLLRLALELQVDALLLTIGAAARAADAEQVPWRRWAVEDLDAARMLAQTLLAHDTAPPATLGRGGVGVGADDALADLVARYSSMDGLLGSVLERPYAGQAWRPVARETRARCRARLEELHRHRGSTYRRQADGDRRYLPGELLG
ncbi:hypothetical protein [Kineosporia sp. R_H_3]|uniref:hypothetical protein n=1 Tax=Kineosporia sp. R_H_3 TaxID=1961848 RepID=UPI000B4A7826|nr:hypothetical protein [Kineosporia sp. R_H_3]